jgi:hypothetical protein
MERQDAKLSLQRVPCLHRLSSRNSRCDHDIAEHTRLAGWKRQHVRCPVFSPKSSIERADPCVGDEGDRECTGGARGCDRLQPAAESRRAS